MPKFSWELSLMLSTIVQNFKKFSLQVFPKNMFKFQKNQNFTDKFFLNTIPRPKFVTNDNNFLLDNKYGCNWCPHQILAKLVYIWPNCQSILSFSSSLSVSNLSLSLLTLSSPPHVTYLKLP